jgi:predicted TPR repeat methyltransferase
MNFIIELQSALQTLPVFNSYHQYIVVPAEYELAPQLQEASPQWLRTEFEHAIVYKAEHETSEDVHSMEGQLRSSGLVRVFEYCWLPEDYSEALHSYLVKALFSAIAFTYDDLITAEKNCNCYEHLYEAAKHKKQTLRSRILDFGCGTGTIMLTRLFAEVDQLTGFDSCAEMVAQAEAKGLTVIPPPAENLAGQRFDIILAAYVMHFGVPTADLFRLLRMLEVGGVFAANFHKGIHLHSSLESLKNFYPASFQFEVSQSPFGPVLSVLRTPTTGEAIC